MSYKVKLDSVQYEIVRQALKFYAIYLDAEAIECNVLKDRHKEASIAKRMIAKEFAEREEVDTDEADTMYET